MNQQPQPNPRPLYDYFQFTHLPAGPLKEVSKQFYYLANELKTRHEANATDPREFQVALRKLLESKDAAVRSMLT